MANITKAELQQRVTELEGQLQAAQQQIEQLSTPKEPTERVESTVNGEFIFSEDNRTIVYKMRSKGQVMTGVAKLHEDDVYNENYGKALAMMRCEYNIRKRDLNDLAEVRDKLKQVIDFFDIQGLGKRCCRLWNIYYQDACEQYKQQSWHCKRQQAYIQAMLRPEDMKELTGVDLFDKNEFPTYDTYPKRMHDIVEQLITIYEELLEDEKGEV